MTKMKAMERLMRRSFVLGSAILLALSCMAPAWAQDLRITFPANNQKVRGEIKVRWEGVPEGGYAMVKVDGQLRSATAEPSYTINTMPPNFPDDGPHTITITAINAAGKRAGETSVTFIVANKEVEEGAEAVQLAIWRPTDIFLPVQRYRVFAESNGIVDMPSAAGAGGSSGGGDSGSVDWIPAPLDWQVTALLRRIVRDVGMIDGSANIRTVVDNAFQRQRLSEASASAAGGAAAPTTSSKKKKGPAFPVKAPWNYHEKTGAQLWEPAPETGQYFVKMVQPTGEEINATRKANTLPLADLLPTFPVGPVRPGNTWTTTMTFLGELSQRRPIDVEHRMLFSTFESIKTPAGVDIRAAKLESRFQLPESKARDIAVALAPMAGGAGGAGGGGSSSSGGGGAMPAPGAGGAAVEFDPELILSARTNVSRVLWFDIANRRVVRCEDRLNTVFEMEAAAGDTGGSSAAAGGPGGAAMPTEPTKVTYTLFIATEFDDTTPESSPLYTAGFGTAHRDPAFNPDAPELKRPNNRDKTLVRDPSLSKILNP